MKIGYARVSTKDQNLDMQIKAFHEEGCERIYQEKKSAFSERPEFDMLKKTLRNGDTLVIWAIDRIGRNMLEIFENSVYFQKNEINLVVLTPRIDTSTMAGKLLFTVMAMLAETEINLKKERIRAGREIAKQQGRTGGRKPGLSKDAKLKAKRAAKLYNSIDPAYSVREIADILKISLRTLYKYLEHEKVEIGKRTFNN